MTLACLAFTYATEAVLLLHRMTFVTCTVLGSSQHLRNKEPPKQVLLILVIHFEDVYGGHQAV